MQTNIKRDDNSNNIDSEFETKIQRWNENWIGLQADISRLNNQTDEKLVLFERALQAEQRRMQQFYDTIDAEAKAELDRRRQQIDQAVNGARTAIDDVLKKPTNSLAAVNELSAVMTDVFEKKLPRFEIVKATKQSDALIDLYKQFQFKLIEWKLYFKTNKEQQFPPAKLKTKLKTKTKTKKGGKTLLRKLGMVAPSPSKRLVVSDTIRTLAAKQKPVKDEATDVISRQKGGEVAIYQLRKIAYEFAASLRQLKSDLWDASQERINARRLRQRSVLEQGTQIPELTRQINAVKEENHLKSVAVSKLRENADRVINEHRQTCRTNYISLQEQQSLIENLRPSQQRARSSHLAPAKGAIDFADQVAKMYPQYRMPAVNAAVGSRCNTSTKGQNKPTPYQELLSDLTNPAFDFRGFVAFHGTGSGKTGLSCLAIQKWFLSQLQETGRAGSPAMVLLPNKSLIPNWTDEAGRWLTEFRVDILPLSKRNDTPQTRVLQLTWKTDNSKIAYILIHDITFLLPDTAVTFLRNFADGRQLVENDGFALGSTTGSYTQEAYRLLTPQERQTLQTSFEHQIIQVLKKRVAVCDTGLIIVDEAHNLINPQEIASKTDTALKVMAWANVLSQAKRAKLLLLTATPLLDTDKVADLFKLLNFIQTNPSQQFFQGTWRRALSRDDDPASLKQAYVRADELESLYIVNTLFTEHEDTNKKKYEWRPVEKQKFNAAYAGTVSYVTLSNDPSVYPSFATSCGFESCTYLWNETTSKLDELKVNDLKTQYDLPVPAYGRNVLVPMTAEQFNGMRKAMVSDLNDWVQTRRLSAPETSRDYANLNYSASTKIVQSSMLASYGTKTFKKHKNIWSPKAMVVLHLLTKYPTDKFFVYTTASDKFFSQKMTLFFNEVGEREVLDITQADHFWKKNNHHEDDADLLKKITSLWYDTHKPEQRVMMFVAPSQTPKKGKEKGIDVNVARSFLVALFNDSRNNHGEYFQAFVGDRTTKEGISLFHTMHAIVMDVPASAAMAQQSEARVKRHCSHRDFPHNRWSELILWRLINVPYIPKKRGGVAASHKEKQKILKTNEQYQYSFLADNDPPSLLLLQAVKELSLDCELFREYNKDVGPCSGSGSVAMIKQQQDQPGQPASDQFCVGNGTLLLLDRTSPFVAEVHETNANLSAFPATQFAAKCSSFKQDIAPSVSYRDYLILHGMQAVRDETVVADVRTAARNELARKQNLEVLRKIGPNNVNVWLTFQLLETLANRSASSVKSDMETWIAAASLDQPQKIALSAFITSRLNRYSAQERAPLVAQVDQINEWIVRKIKFEKSKRVLFNLLDTLPTIQDVLAQLSVLMQKSIN